MHYILVGLSHKTAPLDLRERCAFPEAIQGRALNLLLSDADVREAMLLSTCNRVEAYLVARHEERGAEAARSLFCRQAGVSPEAFDPHLYVRRQQEAVRHLFRVTAGLDSMIVGEPQIGGQVKEAYSEAVSHRSTGTYLNKLVHRALHVAKEVRSRTTIGRLPVSVGYAAVVLASKIFDDLAAKTVLVIGAGEIGELTCRHLKERRVERILVANRTQAHAERVAQAFSGEVIAWDDLASALGEADIVIGSIDVERPLVTEEMIRAARKRRNGRSMFLIDLGVPRNIVPQVNQIENVYLYNIDELQGIVEANLKTREREVVRAEGIIREEVEGFQRQVREMTLVPTIRDLSKKFDRIRRGEIERLFSRHPNLTDAERESLDLCTSAIVGKILHDPILLMKNEEAEGGPLRYSEILKKLFRLTDDETASH